MQMLSVVIPARNAASTLGAQLAALARQTHAGPWEVIVVDNGSTDGTRQIAEHAVTTLPLRIVEMATPGTNFARNAGAEVARGDFLLFVDADDVVAPEWLEAMAKAAETADAVCGPLDRTRFTDPKFAVPGRGATTGLTPWSGYLSFASGANSGVSTAVFQEIGGFDASYSHGGDDVEFFWRVQLHGHEITFVPDAVVYYRERRRLRDVARQFAHYGRQDPHLYRDFRDLGCPPIPLRQSLRSWVHLVVKAPRYWSSPAGRRQWVRSAARRAGRIRGSLEWRARYL
jgi:glycosyltransferase involved in cell wall biosynthesis